MRQIMLGAEKIRTKQTHSIVSSEIRERVYSDKNRTKKGLFREQRTFKN